jgi:anti-sigma B factor antagonist
MADRFEATARRNGDAGIVDISGELDGGAAEPLQAAYAEAAPGASRVILNFGGLTYMNSTGIALVVELLARARAEKQAVHAYGLSDHYRQIFEITRLSDFLAIHADETSAVA